MSSPACPQKLFARELLSSAKYSFYSNRFGNRVTERPITKVSSDGLDVSHDLPESWGCNQWGPKVLQSKNIPDASQGHARAVYDTYL